MQCKRCCTRTALLNWLMWSSGGSGGSYKFSRRKKRECMTLISISLSLLWISLLQHFSECSTEMAELRKGRWDYSFPFLLPSLWVLSLLCCRLVCCWVTEIVHIHMQSGKQCCCKAEQGKGGDGCRSCSAAQRACHAAHCAKTGILTEESHRQKGLCAETEDKGRSTYTFIW